MTSSVSRKPEEGTPERLPPCHRGRGCPERRRTARKADLVGPVHRGERHLQHVGHARSAHRGLDFRRGDQDQLHLRGNVLYEMKASYRITVQHHGARLHLVRHRQRVGEEQPREPDLCGRGGLALLFPVTAGDKQAPGLRAAARREDELGPARGRAACARSPPAAARAGRGPSPRSRSGTPGAPGCRRWSPIPPPAAAADGHLDLSPVGETGMGDGDTGPMQELTILSRSWMARVTPLMSTFFTPAVSAPTSSRMAPSFERLRRVTIRAGER